jgi:comEA protein
MVFTLFILVVFSFSAVSIAAQETDATQPTKQTSKTTKASPTKEQIPPVKININKAVPAELEKLRGVGPKAAQAIVQYREANGPFKSIEDIQKVKGIGKKKFESLKDSITVD